MKFGTYKIIIKEKLVIEYYSGTINTDDLICMKDALRKEPDYSFYHNSIIDVRDCILDIDSSEYKELIDYTKKNIKENGIRKVAYLTSKPKDVVMSSLYPNLANENNLGFVSGVFSTEKSVVSWFGKEIITESHLTDIINELKTMPNILCK